MQVSIATRHGRLSDSSQTKIRAKAEKLSRFFDRLTSIELIVDLEDPQRPKVDLNVSAEHKHDFVAREQAESLLAAVDAAIAKVEQQLRKYKEKVQQKHRDGEPKRLELPVEGGLGDDSADDLD